MSKTEVERRLHKRVELSCPITVTGVKSGDQVETNTLNISDGGALIAVPSDCPIQVGDEVSMALRILRHTANTRMFEDFASSAKILRCQWSADGQMCLVTQVDHILDMRLGV